VVVDEVDVENDTRALLDCVTLVVYDAEVDALAVDDVENVTVLVGLADAELLVESEGESDTLGDDVDERDFAPLPVATDSVLDGEKDTEAVAEIDSRPVRELESRGLRDWLLVVRHEIVVVDESERERVPLTETLTVGEIDWLVVGDPVVDEDDVADGEDDDDAVWLTLGVVERVPDGEPVALGDGHTDAVRETVGEVDKERVPLGDNDVVGDCERDRVPLTVDVTLGVAVTDPEDVAHRLRLGVVVAERVMVGDALVLRVVVVERVSDGDADCVGVVDALSRLMACRIG
jgi:hypothetical protein